MAKILIIGPSLKMGGMERASANIANTLNSLDHSVFFISLFNQTHFFKLNDGISFIEPSNFNKNRLNFFNTIKWIRTEVKRVNPSRIIVFNKFYSAIVLLALWKTDFKIYISERSSPLYKWGFKISLFNKIIFYFIPPAGVIAQTNIAATYQRKYYKNKVPIKVIPNVLREVNTYPNIEREKIILAVGRFNDYLKGFDLLILAFSKIKKNGWKLVFAGNEDDETNLKKLTIDLKLENSVEFIGKVKDIDLLYARASIFVIPSRSEGFPNALCEAMAAGLACISYDFIAGPRDIINENKNGIIVENGNVLSLSEAIEDLIFNKSKRLYLGQNAINIKNLLEEKKIGIEIQKFIFNN